MTADATALPTGLDGHILDRFRLDGRVALVTGASHGIGEGMALAFAEAGADVALAARTQADLERVAALVRGLGRRAIVAPTDVSDLDAIQRMVDRTVEAYGRLDILLNAAGVQRRKPIVEMTVEDWNYVMDVNLRGAYFVSQAAARAMIPKRQGKIIQIASMTGYRGFTDVSLYGMSKAAIMQMTKTMALEWARHNIQVTAIAPGWIATPMTVTMTQSRKDWVNAHVPQGHFGLPADLAGMAVYLASAASDYVTGQTIPVDGGFIAGNPWAALDE